MKKISLFIFVLLALVLSSLEMKSQSDCYNANGCNTTWSTSWMGVVFPQFPTCTLTVEVKTRICNGQTQIWCRGIYFYDPFSDCTAMIQWLWPNGWQQGQSPDPEKAQNVFNYVYEDIMKQLFKTATQNLKSLFLCDGPPYMPEWTEYTYYKASCISLCWALMSGSATHPNFQFIYLGFQHCIDECCQVVIKYCWESVNATEPKVTRTVIPSPNQSKCETYPKPSCNFPPGTIIIQGQSDCSSQNCQ